MSLSQVGSSSSKLGGFNQSFNLVCAVVASCLGQDDPLEVLRANIPGEPGTDYPIHSSAQVLWSMVLDYSRSFNIHRVLTEE